MRGRRLATRIGHHALRALAAVVLTVGLSALLMLADATGLLPRQFAAPSARGSHFLPQGNNTIALLSPSSGQGPVGAEITVQGSQWTDAEVAIGAASSAANCANPTAGSASGWVASFGTTTQITGGSFTFSFPWPASLSSGGPYTLCAAPSGQSNATGISSSPQTYTVRSAQPPALTLSSSTVQVGQPFTITGSSFYGAPTVTVTVNGTKIHSVQPDGNGSFVVSYTPTVAQVGDDSIQAQSPPEGNAPPVLTASAQIIVSDAPTVTPSPTPSPTPTIEPTATGAVSGQVSGNPPSSGGGGGGLIIALVIAILLLLALLAGIAVFLIMRRRGGPGSDYPGGPGGPGDWGGYPGPGRGTGPVPQYGQTAPGRYGATNFYGPGTPYPAQDTYPGAGPQMGGVSQWGNASQAGGVFQWDDPGDSAPGPDWQPRPMSGRQYEDSGYPTYQPPQDAPASGASGPPDPWGGTTTGYSGPPQRPTPPRSAPQRQDNGWDDGDPDQPATDWNPRGGTRGPGGTNPTNGGW